MGGLWSWAKLVVLIGMQILFLETVCSDSKVRILLVGQVMPETCPAPMWFDSEPLVEYVLVPTKIHLRMSLEDAQRSVKTYFPRNKGEVESYDFFMFINPYFEPFTPVQVENLRSAIVEGGKGGFQTLGGITINWAEVNWPWLQSTLAPIFPNDPEAYEAWENNKPGNLPYRVEVVENPSLPPVLKMFVPLGIQETPGYWTICLILPQEGATVWARARGAYPMVAGGPHPWLLSWRYGEGMTWSVADDLDCPWWSGIYRPSEQRYGLDILMNIVLYSLGRPLPEDVVLVNRVRRSFQRYSRVASRLSSVLDFAERFGAPTHKLLDHKHDIDEVLEGAKETYMDGLYVEALDESKKAVEELMGLEERAIALKNQALVWVYVIEWAAVTGTSMITGVVLYLLMMEKRLYREVDSTRGA